LQYHFYLVVIKDISNILYIGWRNNWITLHS